MHSHHAILSWYPDTDMLHISLHYATMHLYLPMDICFICAGRTSSPGCVSVRALTRCSALPPLTAGTTYKFARHKNMDFNQLARYKVFVSISAFQQNHPWYSSHYCCIIITSVILAATIFLGTVTAKIASISTVTL
jgi:hypothetical protein